MNRGLPLALLLMVSLFRPAMARERQEQPRDFGELARQGHKLRIKATTFVGTGGIERLVAAQGLPDGSVVVLGNAWGEDLPRIDVRPRVIGNGRAYPVNPYVWGDRPNHPDRLDPRYPNQTGFMLQLGPELRQAKRLVAFDRGVAWITAATLTSRGHLIIAGKGTAYLEKLRVATGGAIEPPQDGDLRYLCRPTPYQGHDLAEHVYVAQVDLEAGRLEWLWLLKHFRRPVTSLIADADGGVLFNAHGLRHIPRGGKACRPVRVGSDAATDLSVMDVAADGSLIIGGHTVTGTGREGWTQPRLIAMAAADAMQWQVFDWNPYAIGLETNRLKTAGRVVQARMATDGSLLVAASSFSGKRGSASRTVLLRQPTDVDAPAPVDALGAERRLGKVKQAIHLLRINPRSLQTQNQTSLWVDREQKIPRHLRRRKQRGPTDQVLVEHLLPLRDGGVAVAGHATGLLVQTPNAVYDESKFQGESPTGGLSRKFAFVAVYTAGLDELLYCSMIPAVRIAGLTETGSGILVAANASDKPDEGGLSAPAGTIGQRQHAGGRSDGYLLLLKKPARTPAAPATPRQAPLWQAGVNRSGALPEFGVAQVYLFTDQKPGFVTWRLKLSRPNAEPLYVHGRSRGGRLGVTLKKLTKEERLAHRAGVGDLSENAAVTGHCVGELDAFSGSGTGHPPRVGALWLRQEQRPTIAVGISSLEQCYRLEPDEPYEYRAAATLTMRVEPVEVEVPASVRLSFRTGSGWGKYWSPPIVQLSATFELPGKALGLGGLDAGPLRGEVIAMGWKPNEDATEELEQMASEQMILDLDEAVGD